MIALAALMCVVAVVAIAWALFFQPATSPATPSRPRAPKRQTSSTEAIAALCIVAGFVFWPLLLVGILVYCLAPKQPTLATAGAPRQPAPDLRTPVVREMVGNDAGLFLVCGVDRDSGLDTSLRIRAESPANAKAKAELRGMVVTKIDLP